MMEKKEKKEGEDIKKKELKELKEIKAQLENCLKEKEQYLNGWKRARADFLNYKKAEGERLQDLVKYANKEFLLKLLPVLDALTISEKEIPDDLKDNAWVKGLLNTKKIILNFFKEQGVKEIKAVGEKFDPNLHEAVEVVELPDKESGIIVEEIKKGYLFEEKVLRPAKVKVVK